MIKQTLRKVAQSIGRQNFSASKSPIIFGNGRSTFSLSQLWNGIGEKPFDYYLHDDLQVEIQKEWKLENGLFRALYSAHLNDPSMNININHLKKSAIINQLIQLEASEKEKLVDSPSTVIIIPNLVVHEEAIENQISKNILELDKLFESAVGLKMGYLIDANSFSCAEYLLQLKKREKAVSADVVVKGAKFQEVIFNNGYKLEHIFLDGTTLSPWTQTDFPFRYEYNLRAVIEVLTLIDFKGKLILPGGDRQEAARELITKIARQFGYSQKLEIDLESDSWYTML